MEKTFKDLPIYEAIYRALEEGDYSKQYEITKDFSISLWDSEEDRESRWFERAVVLHHPSGQEVFTLDWSRREKRYFALTEAQLFSGEVDIIACCAEEIEYWIEENL